jgi:hypothetical protein
MLASTTSAGTHFFFLMLCLSIFLTFPFFLTLYQVVLSLCLRLPPLPVRIFSAPTLRGRTCTPFTRKLRNVVCFCYSDLFANLQSLMREFSAFSTFIALRTSASSTTVRSTKATFLLLRRWWRLSGRAQTSKNSLPLTPKQKGCV